MAKPRKPKKGTGRTLKVRRGLAFKDPGGRYRNLRGQIISRETYRELKEREKDASYRTAVERADKEKRANKAEVGRSVRSSKKRQRRLKKAARKVPSAAQREAQLARGHVTGQLFSQTSYYRTTVYVFEGVESLPLVRDFVRDLMATEPPGTLVRITIRAGNGRAAESIGSLYDTPRKALRYLASVEHRQSAKQLFERAEEENLPIYIDVEVKRPITQDNPVGNRGKRKSNAGKKTGAGRAGGVGVRGVRRKRR